MACSKVCVIPTTNLPIIRIVLIGRHGSDKSKLGNELLGYTRFKPNSSVIADSEYGKRVFKSGGNTCLLRLGLFGADEITQANATALTSPGTNLFILVIDLKEFTDRDKQVVQELKDLFGPGIMEFVTIVFINASSLDAVQKNLESATDELRQLGKECRNRYEAIDFNDKKGNRKKSVQNINNMLISSIFTRSIKDIQSREEEIRQLRKEIEVKEKDIEILKNESDQMKNEIESKNTEIENKKNEIKKMKNELEELQKPNYVRKAVKAVGKTATAVLTGATKAVVGGTLQAVTENTGAIAKTTAGVFTGISNWWKGDKKKS